MMHSARRRPGRSALAALVAPAMLAGLLAGVAIGPAGAAVTGVSGSAFGYYVNVGLFGGPHMLRGYGQVAAPADSSSPSVMLPPGGSSSPVTSSKPLGAQAVYGPAVIFGGIWPEGVGSGPPSGPMSVSTESSQAGDSVTSSAHVVRDIDAVCPDGTTDCAETNPADVAADGPGGFGPGPLVGDQAHSTCTASESGVTGSATFLNGYIETKYDAQTQLPLPEFVVPMPNPVPPNWTISGTIDHVGDRFTIVLNEQILSPDGDSITVNAAHMYLLGDIARGDMVVASSTCAVTSTVANAAPVAMDDSFSTIPDTPLSVPANGLLSNDTDADGHALATATAQPVFVPGPDPTKSAGSTHIFPGDPANGTATVAADGSFTYTPDPGFVGVDTFTYVAHDPRGAFDQGTVTVNVRPSADLSVSIVDAPDPVQVRKPLTYTIGVANAGPSPATAANVVLQLSGASYVSASGASCAVMRGRNSGVRCDFGTMASGAGTSFTVTATASPKPGTASVTATVSSTTLDEVAGNNSAATTTAILR